MLNSNKAACSFQICGATFWADGTAAIGMATSRSTLPLIGGNGEPAKTSRSDNWLKPCMTPGSRARRDVEYRADYVRLDQGRIAFCTPTAASRWKLATVPCPISCWPGRAGEAVPCDSISCAGRLLLRDGKFEIEQGKLQTPASIYQLSGTASLSRVLDIKLARDGARGFNITGTLTQPHVAVSTTPDTQAALKP